jgi:hypothetical protein
MESKKINQLATELTPALSDLTIIGDPTTGISKKITLSQMASLFTGTVEEYPSLASFPLVGVADTIYIATDTNILYRWDTSLNAYAELSPNIVTSLVFSDANGFDGTISLVGSVATLTITTALTQGSVPFIGASGALSQDNANLFFDDTNNRLGINTNSPTTALDVFGSGIIGRINGTSTNNAFLGFASAGSNKWSIGNVQSDHRFRIYSEANTSELVSVLQTGEFGIGIANPTTKLHIDGGASALIANLDANVSVAKSISFRSDNSNRINLEVSGTESGSNAGANFFLRTYTDAGALLATPLTITRSTGLFTLGGNLEFVNGNFLSMVWASDTRTIWERFNSSTYFQRISSNGTLRQLRLESNGAYGNASIVLDGESNTTTTTTITSDKIVLSGTLSGTSATFSNGIFTDGSQGLSVRAYTGGAGFGAIYSTGVTPGAGNFALAASSTQTILSGVDSVNLAINSAIKLAIANTGAATFSSTVSTTGVVFPSSQILSSDPNTLDDYEEGTFTPNISFSTSGSPTYSFRTGFYTKVGRQVTVIIVISFNDSTGSGNVTIGGLPFTSISTNYCRAVGSFLSGGISGATDGLQGQVPQSSSQVDLYYANAGASTRLTNSNTSTDTDIYCSLTYFTT